MKYMPIYDITGCKKVEATYNKLGNRVCVSMVIELDCKDSTDYEEGEVRFQRPLLLAIKSVVAKIIGKEEV